MMAKILIADDDVRLAELLRTSLGMEGHEVVLAHNVPDACAIHDAPESAINITLSDINYSAGGREGLDLLRYIRRKDPEAAVILFSGSPREAVNKMMQELGREGLDVPFIQKPFAREVLLAEINRIKIPARPTEVREQKAEEPKGTKNE